MLILKNLTLTLTKDLRTLIEDFSFSLQEDMKVALIGEEGNGKSTLLKAIAEPSVLQSYIEMEGEIIKAGEVIGYLPQVLPDTVLAQTTDSFLEQRVDWDLFDYPRYHELLRKLNFPEDRINQNIRVGDLSGGEKIKFQLLCEMLRWPTVLLLDEPSNDLDLESVSWLEHFIRDSKIPIMFVSHDEMLLESCTNTVIHLEQLMRKRRPQYTVVGLSYKDYVENRNERIVKQTQVAQKERQEYEAKMDRYRQIYQGVHHAQQTVSRQTPGEAKNLKDKMHSVKSMGRRFERQKEQMTKRPDFEESIVVRFEDSISIPQGKLVLDLKLDILKVDDLILSRDVVLNISGPKKVCIIGANGAGKTTLLRQVLGELEQRETPYGYMPQDYTEQMNPRYSAIQFLTKTGTKDEHTEIRTYLGSMNFTVEEMHHPVADLSGGQRAKLYFSKMILDRAEVLVLDEPTRNLSPLSGPEIRQSLQAFGGCIVAVSHDRRFVLDVFDEVFLLDERGLHAVNTSEWSDKSRLS